MTLSHRRWAIRILIAVALIVGAGLLVDRLARRAPPVRPCQRAITAADAARSQQGQPTTAPEALRQLDTQLAFARTQAASAPADASGPFVSVAGFALAHGQLTGNYADFETARQAIDAAFARAPAGLGPHLLRASFNMTVHRLAPVLTDVASVERYKLPDPGDVAAATGIRGDLLFYRGDYRRALPFYERADAAGGGAGTKIRLATYWAKMGDDSRARAYLDQAECAVSGPQQQLQAFIETQRALLDMDRGKWDDAQASLEKAAAIFPGYWSIEFQLASVLGLKGDLPRAEALLRRIAARDRVPEAYDALAGLLRARGDVPGARQAVAVAERLWQARIALFPEAAYGHAVTHYLTFADPRVALQFAERNHRARPYAPSATMLASAYLANGRPADALRAIRPVLESGWVSADAQVVAAETYALLGQGEAADAARRRALAINPHSFDRNLGLTWLEH